MGFLKRFFNNVLRDGTEPMECNTFERIPRIELESHLSVARYGEFWLTEAIRPSVDLTIMPEEGYRRSFYTDKKNGSIPVLTCSISREKLFDTFIDMLEPLGKEVDVILETSHSRRNHRNSSSDLYREQIDLPVLISYLYDYEDLLLNDGCTGIAIINPENQMEVQFDEHKLIVVYANDLKEYESILTKKQIARKERMKFITEAEHIHTSHPHHIYSLHTLSQQLGMDW
jgi:hypothetical protein